MKVIDNHYIVKVFKALGHQTRLQIVKILNTEGDKCVCELTALTRFDISTISKHLSILKEANLVTSSRKGNMIIYKSLLPCLSYLIECIECRHEKEQS